jgi:hypothetical protein
MLEHHAIRLNSPITVKILAEALQIRWFEVVSDLMGFGIFADLNHTIEDSVAVRVCLERGHLLARHESDGVFYLIRPPQE